MNTPANTNEIASQLNSLHDTARQAFLNRDLDAYRDCFTDDLQYTQVDGATITRDQLIRDVGPQLRQFKFVDMEYVRESISIYDGISITQTLKQTGSYSITVFLFFTKKWRIVRRGNYTYRNTEDGWRICAVKVLEESVS